MVAMSSIRDNQNDTINADYTYLGLGTIEGD